MRSLWPRFHQGVFLLLRTCKQCFRTFHDVRHNDTSCPKCGPTKWLGPVLFKKYISTKFPSESNRRTEQTVSTGENTQSREPSLQSVHRRGPRSGTFRSLETACIRQVASSPGKQGVCLDEESGHQMQRLRPNHLWDWFTKERIKEGEAYTRDSTPMP